MGMKPKKKKDDTQSLPKDPASQPSTSPVNATKEASDTKMVSEDDFEQILSKDPVIEPSTSPATAKKEASDTKILSDTESLAPEPDPPPPPAAIADPPPPSPRITKVVDPPSFP